MLKQARVFGVLVALAIGVAACNGSGGAAGRAGLPRLDSAPAPVAAHGSGVSAPAQSPAGDQAPASTGAGAGAGAPKKAAGGTQAAPGSTTRAASPAGTPSVAAPPASGPAAAAAAPTGVPRRQPTAAEVSAAISQVHNAIHFYTPSASDVASVGDQVCTAFDQGKTFSQVTSKALDMIGAGPMSWLIPSSAPARAVRTLVAMYCPGYTSKLG